MQKLTIIDSHTAGEPTRIVVAGAPDLGHGTIAERLQVLRSDHAWLRPAVVNEPRGSDVLVGALLCEPSDPSCSAGVIFFNNVGYLGMCGHGTIGLIATLKYMGKLDVGEHRIETPVGIVTTTLHADGRVSVQNVPSYRHLKDVHVQVDGLGEIVGDVAWGGNWFFLVDKGSLLIQKENVEQLTDVAWRIREALERDGISGANGALIDHIELFGPGNKGTDSRSFVLCPGKAYDRSPCGTGTSAKLACLAADGKLAPDTIWVQESVIYSRFEGSYTLKDNQIIPTITGRAYITLEGTILIDEHDPFRFGIR